MNRRLEGWILVCILALAFIVRLVNLTNTPAGFTPDEASFGYDAYSILTTGKDQWGVSLPIVLKSFGDYKAPVYAYLAVPSVAIFGLNEFAVRLPNAILGALAILVVFFLARRLDTQHRSLSLVAAFLLAISPWHIMLSRGAFEANLITFFLPLAVLLFLIGLNIPKVLLISALTFGVTLFTYHSSKIIVPGIVLLLLILYKNELEKVQTKFKIWSAIVLSLLTLAAALTFFQGAGSRAAEVSIFRSFGTDVFETRTNLVKGGLPDNIARVVSNKYVAIARAIFDRYTSYFSTKFLYVDGPAETTYGMLPGIGVSYWFEFILLIFAVAAFIKTKKTKGLWLVFLWLAIGPIPAALTSGAGYAGNRAAGMMPALQVVEAYGAVSIWVAVHKFGKRLFTIFSLGAFSLICFSILSFLLVYFVASPYKSAIGMLDGNLNAVRWLTQNTTATETVLVSKSLSEPQIYIAFAEKLDPKIYQLYSNQWNFKGYGVDWVDQIPEYNLGNIVFSVIGDNSINEYKIIIGKPSEFKNNVTPAKVIKYPDGSDALWIVNGTSKIYAQGI